MRKERRLTGRALALYCAVFYLVWGVREIVLLPIMLDALGPVAEAWAGSAVKLLIWTLPAILLIRVFEKDMWLSLKGMLVNKADWRPYLAIAAAFCPYYVIAAYRMFGQVGVSPNFDPAALIGAVLFVGVTEEAVFRGWLLNAALKKRPYWAALSVNAALFVVIHFPIWISKGLFTDPLTVLSNCAGIFLLSLLFSWAFVRSKNIFVPIVLHMAWNLCNVVFIGG